MASIPTLFNLDPTQFALGRSTGRLRNVIGAPTTQNVAELGNLLQGIKEVSAVKPGEFTLAKPNEAPYTGQSLIDKALAALDRSPVKVNDIASIVDIPMYASNYIKQIVNKQPVTLGNFMGTGTQQTLYNRAAAAVNSALDPFKQEVNAYNTALGEYKNKAETYAADVNRYYDEQEAARNKFQSEYLTQNVEDPNLQTEGDVLAASSLYSDTLHQQMLERIAEANTEDVGTPGSDRVISLYS